MPNRKDNSEENLFNTRRRLLAELEELDQTQFPSYSEYYEEFKKKDRLYIKLLQESNSLGHSDEPKGKGRNSNGEFTK